MSPGFQDFDIEVLASGESGDLAYVVTLERSRFRPDASTSVQNGFTRVTQIFRREQGQWRLLHRHMDHLPEQFTLPTD
jgi:ketosteroid isomerase-like protein